MTSVRRAPRWSGQGSHRGNTMVHRMLAPQHQRVHGGLQRGGGGRAGAGRAPLRARRAAPRAAAGLRAWASAHPQAQAWPAANGFLCSLASSLVESVVGRWSV